MSGGFVEFGAATNFSFLRGASHPAEMIAAAKALGHTATATADRNTLAGAVRSFAAAREAGLRHFTGARLVTRCGFETLCYPVDRAAYGRLSKLLTDGNRRAEKGACHLDLPDLAAAAAGQIFIALPGHAPGRDWFDRAAALQRAAPGRVYLGAACHYRGDDRLRLARLAERAAALRLDLVATNDALYHARARRPLADLLACIREGVTIDAAGFLLDANAERHLKSEDELARLFAGQPQALARSAEIAARINFSLSDLAYEYPDETAANGETPQAALVRRAWEGAAQRYPGGVPDSVRAVIAHELDLIGSLNYAPYFLTVDAIVRFARSRGILCQGRGSAANSAVCYCLGVTAVDPAKADLLFERFVSAERREPPDIDVDFEHERREEVIQHIYETYGRARAGIAATVITYRAKSAIRDAGKAMGLPLDMIDALSRGIWGWPAGAAGDTHVREIGLDPDAPRLRLALDMAHALTGFPRHLSQHVGGFVITRGALDEVVPIGNAAMPDRTFIEWDKDDLDTLGILKIDILALGMLTCIAKGFALLTAHYDRPMGLADVPAEDPAVYDMLCAADSIGVFQVESRAQMSMLPRLKPRCFYDLVIEVAIVRPGPIQGDMVHPYLRRRDGIEPVSYPSKDLEQVLGKTLGVPLFQEQAMKIAIVAAGFTPSEADQLRRAMATFRKTGLIHTFRAKMTAGMLARGYTPEFTERCFNQLEGFGEYGFPESHAASFALLVYVSSWLKRWYPDVFLAALLNAQPLGFYAPAQLVRDAHEHGVAVRSPDINDSLWDARLEADGAAKPQAAQPFAHEARYAVRLGFRQIKGLRAEDAQRLEAARADGPFDSVRDLWLRTRLSPAALERLAGADAMRSIGLDRRDALWAVKGLEGGAAAREGGTLTPLALFAHDAVPECADDGEVSLPRMPLGEHVVHDYATLSLSLKAHPLVFLRERLSAMGCVPLDALKTAPSGRRLTLAGLVLVRQRPGTAKGVIFATLEDETGPANIIVWPKTFEAYRRVVLGARLLMVTGEVQRQGLVIHVIASRLYDLTHELAALSHDGAIGEAGLARADEVRRPGADARGTARREAEALPRSRDFH